ncbi:MAG: guanylate kinase [Oscillospiraceae bacterium]|jgi:guanylate kinase|nr:guanylate kinase [Oscillospiraceae bacterium]
MAKLFVLSGPSGAGKSSILKRVLEETPNVAFSVSATTRAPRPGEVDGVHYYFITPEEFRRRIADGELLEYNEHFDTYYGTPRGEVSDRLASGVNVILDIETKGAKQVFDKCPEAVGVFCFPPSFEILEERLRGRGTDSEEKIRQRLEKAREEYGERGSYSYHIINDDLDEAVNRFKWIIEREKNEKIK